MADRYLNVDTMRPSAASKWTNRAAAAVQARYDGFTVGLGVTDYAVGVSSGTWDSTGIDAFCAAVAPTGLKASCILSPNTVNYAHASWIAVLGTMGVDYTSAKRMPVAGAEEQAAAHNGGMARFMDQWVYYGGDPDDVRWEVGRELHLGFVNGPQEAPILAEIKTGTGLDIFGYFDTSETWTENLLSFITGNSPGIVDILEAVVPLLDFKDRTVLAPSVAGAFLNTAEAAAISAAVTDVWPYLLGQTVDILTEGYVGAINPLHPLDTIRKEIAVNGSDPRQGSLCSSFDTPWFTSPNIPNLEFGLEVYLGNALSKWQTNPFALAALYVIVARARMRLMRQYLAINGFSNPRLHIVEWGLARGWRTGSPSAPGRCNHSEIAFGNCLGAICAAYSMIPGLDSHAMYDWVSRSSSYNPPAGAQESFAIIASDELTVSKAFQSLCVANGGTVPADPPFGSWYSVGVDAGVEPEV